MKSKTKTRKGFKIVTLNQSELGKYFKLPNPDLQAHFARIIRGNSEVYGTPFYGISDISDDKGKLKKLDEIMNGWQRIMESSSLPNEWPTLLEFENDLRKKVGPMSVMKPLSGRMSDIESYWIDVHSIKSSSISEAAVEATIAELSKIRGLRVRSDENTLVNMKKSSNSGNPFYSTRRDVISQTFPIEVHPEDFSKADSLGVDYTTIQKLGKDRESWNSCAVLGWRGQEGGLEIDDVKQRVIWMFPFAINVKELSWYQPFIEACQQFNLVPAWVSMDAVDRHITRLFETKADDDLIVCTDFSKFDQHFNLDMQVAAERIMWALAQAKDFKTERWFSEIFAVKYNIPLILTDEILVSGTHGMASGSGGTNADETVAHRALQHEAAINAGKVLNPYSMCLGDDGIISYPGISVDDVVATYTRHGQEMNPDKQYASTTDCTYLRRWHHKNYRMNGICVGVYSTYRALNRLAMQERFYNPKKWSKEMVALRYLSILENVKFHPLREQFVDYCIKGDKYRLGIDIPGFLDKIVTFAQKATDEIPDFLGYTRSMQDPHATGIASWWIVKYLKSKA